MIQAEGIIVRLTRVVFTSARHASSSYPCIQPRCDYSQVAWGEPPVGKDRTISSSNSLMALSATGFLLGFLVLPISILMLCFQRSGSLYNACISWCWSCDRIYKIQHVSKMLISSVQDCLHQHSYHLCNIRLFRDLLLMNLSIFITNLNVCVGMTGST